MNSGRFQWQMIVRRTGLAGLWLTALLIVQKRWSGELMTGVSETVVVGTAGAFSLLSVLGMLVVSPRESRSLRRLTRLWLSALPSFLAGLSLLPDASEAGPAGLSVGLMLAVLPPLLIGRPEASSPAVAVAETDVTETESGVPSASIELAAMPSVDSGLSDKKAIERHSTVADVSAVSANGTQPCLIESIPEDPRGPVSGRIAFSRLEEHDVDEIDDELIDESEQESTLQIGPATRQWMTRTIQDDREVIEGGCRIEFSAGQKQAVLHLPFTPALSGTPEFECEAIDGSDVRFRITARLPYGIRMEIARSSGFDQCLRVELGYSASAPLQRQSAAA